MPEITTNSPCAKVLYLVVNEDITSPLLRRQVTELLSEEVSLSEGTAKIKILLFQSISSLVKRWNNLRNLRKELKSEGVLLTIVPSLVPWPIPNLRTKKTEVGHRPDGTWNRMAGKLFPYYAFPYIFYQNLIFNPNIIHSRSYPAALAAELFKNNFSSIKHVFDPRSDFPEENITAGRWATGSRDFRYWKSAEANILRSAEATACISDEYVDHFFRNVGQFSSFVAPNNVDIHKFRFDSRFRNLSRRELDWSSNDLVFVYLGGMSSDGWHRPEFYRRFIDLVRDSEPGAKLLLLVPSHANKVTENCFSGIEGVAIRNPAYAHVHSWLSVGDIGLMFLNRKKIAVGTKFSEYLAVGLPTLCNSNCIGTKRILSENPFAGFVTDLSLGGEDVTINTISSDRIHDLKSDRKRLRKFAERQFSNEAVASRYLSVYKSLINAD